ncbi:endochitinase A [Abeliophyllum distichum]|uniref:Endochitinase A n=1 Tax=Abeliophyllum distichum TaxID=126358 RepID=A0ABD1RBK7_9LAMI
MDPDYQFSENQTEPTTLQLSGCMGAQKEVFITINGDGNDQLPELHEWTEPQCSQRNGRCNMRQSLAWDSAFFTSSGVLDPEELSKMLKGAGKAEKHLLPGIEEDIRRSTESISTLESDSLTLESLEDDLFSDIRASIQRSSRRVFTMTNSGSNVTPVVIDNQVISCLRKEDLASENQLNPKPAVKKRFGMRAIRMSKCQPNQNIGLQGSAKAVEQDSGHSQVTQSIVKIGRSSSSLPTPHKAISRAIPTSTAAAKRSSLSSSVKSQNEGTNLSTVSSKGTQVSKVHALSGTRNVLPKPALSSKSSSSGSSTTSKMQSRRSTSSNSTTSSETTAKSSLLIARRNPIKSSTLNSASSGSIPKTLSKAKLKNEPSSSALSDHLVSTKTSNVSPTSSIGELSSASSSSSSMVNQRSNNSRSSLDTSSGRSVDGDIVSLDLKNQCTNQIADGHKSRGTASPGNITRKSSTQAGTLSSRAPLKVSGLRMPSPKIGFFDGVKSVCTPNGNVQSQSGIPTMLPEKGGAMCSSNSSSNTKPKLRKLPTARTATALANTNPDPQKTTSPISSEEKSYILTNVSTSPLDVKYCSKSSLEVEGNMSGESCLNVQKVVGKGPDDAKLDIDTGSRASMDENLGVLMDEMVFNMHENIATGNFEIVPVEVGNSSGSTSIGQKVDENVLDDQNHAKKPHPICRMDRKENGHIEDQVDRVSKHKRDENSNIYGQMDEIFSEISDCASETSSDITSEPVGSRAPFAVKNSF